jgi:glycogen phosphorylase
VRVERVDQAPAGELPVGSRIPVRANIRLGPIDPGEVAVELYLGQIDAQGEIASGAALPMEPAGRTPDGLYSFEASGVACLQTGLHGYTVRVLPYHPDAPKRFLPGLIAWA